MVIRRPTQEPVVQWQVRAVLEGLVDQERAVADLCSFQKEVADRRLYRIMYSPRRQPIDVEMCHIYSWWLCQYYRGEI